MKSSDIRLDKAVNEEMWKHGGKNPPHHIKVFAVKDKEGGTDPQNPSVDAPLDGVGGVKVELDKVNPPGAMASGSVVFSDGQSKKWTLDQYGRLGLTGGDDQYKPSDEDVAEFQKQLDTALRGRGF